MHRLHHQYGYTAPKFSNEQYREKKPGYIAGTLIYMRIFRGYEGTSV